MMPPASSSNAGDVLDAFNIAFGTNYHGEAWIKRIKRRWPHGWQVLDWELAITALAYGDKWWERQGKRAPHPGMLIGRDGTYLLELRHQADAIRQEEHSDNNFWSDFNSRYPPG